LIGFNLFALIWVKMRRAHLIVAGITLACWFILGIWFGWGYCPITEWQWKIKEKLGETNLPNSFIKYFADKITGKNFPPSLVDNMTLGLFLAAIALSVYFNFFRKRKADISRY
jgi:ABC-type antimicrobial peptide transport system permease subunit